MKKVTKKIISKKTMSYTMDIHVQESLKEIITREGHKTIHQAINACILERKKMLELIRQGELESDKLFLKYNDLDNLISEFVVCIRKMDKHTKVR